MTQTVATPRCQDPLAGDVVHIGRAAATLTLRSLLSQARPFTAVRLGSLSFLTDLLEHNGAQVAADRIYRAAQPLLNVTGSTGLRDVERYLQGIPGRPPAGVSAAVISDDLARAVASGLRMVSDDDSLAACAEVFSTDPSALVLAGVTSMPVAQERQAARFLRDLWRRAGEIERERARAEETDTRLFRVMIEARMTNAAVRLVAPPWRAGKPLVVPEMAAVAKGRRYANRLGAAMATIAVHRLDDALHAGGWSRAFEAVAMLAAVAEAVDTSGRRRGARIPEKGAPIAHTAWRPAQWLPVLVAWSGLTDQRGETAWKLAAHESDAIVVATGWAMSVIGGCAPLDRMRMTDDEVLEWLERSTDLGWAESAMRAWDLMQSTRRPADRAPWPLKHPASWSAWRLSSTDGLPWSLTAGESVDEAADEAAPVEPAAVMLETRPVETPVLEDVVDEPASDARVRVEGGRMDGLTLEHDGPAGGWVLDGDPDRIGSSWSELLDSVTASGGRMVLA